MPAVCGRLHERNRCAGKVQRAWLLLAGPADGSVCVVCAAAGQEDAGAVCVQGKVHDVNERLLSGLLMWVMGLSQHMHDVSCVFDFNSRRNKGRIKEVGSVVDDDASAESMQNAGPTI